MSRSPRLQKAWNKDEAYRQVNHLVDRWQSIESLPELAGTVTTTDVANRVNDILRSLREVTRGKQTHRVASPVVSSGKYTAASITLTAGSSSDALADLQTMLDGNLYTLQEAGGAPGIDLEVAFAGVVSINRISVKGHYDGSTSHAVRIQLYNYTTEVWDTLHTMNDGRDTETHSKLLPDDTNYISGGNARVRLYHTESGSPAHYLYVDEVALYS